MSTARDWELRPFQPSDELSMLDCLRAAFGGWPGVDTDVDPIDHLRWKLTSDPSALRFHPVAATAAGIVGCQIAISQHWKVRDRITRAFLITDTAVYPEYQGQGMMGQLWVNDRPEYVAAVDMLVSISTNRAVKRRHKTIGSNQYLANPLDLLECPTLSSVSTTQPLRIATVERFDVEVDALCARALEPFSFAQARSAAYLNWRYADRRAGNFTIRIATDGQFPVGYSVLRVSRGKAYIADLLVLPERPDVLRHLALDALDELRAQGAAVARCWLARRHSYRDTLLACGFSPVREIEGFAALPMGSRDVTFIATDGDSPIHVMAGDTDII